jgi:hypothetical protein
MKKLTFKCTLESDIIINRKPATEGNRMTLDFIPGNNFYGIVANKLYGDKQVSDDVRYEILHSGKVRFGDAHPSSGKERSYRVPADMYYPKLGGIEETYLNHKVYEVMESGSKEEIKELREKQLKQCRNGFYIFKEGKGLPVEVGKSFALKSAYDRENRRSRDAQMFGYESLNKGLELMFEVYVDDEVDAQAYVTDLLVGEQRVGRSRTAQYGLVAIESLSECSEETATVVAKDKEFYVYADSRLILCDAYGNASATVTPEALGLEKEDCDFLLEKTQIRLFQYSPWNYKRQSHDTDRYGIEKGSVIALKAKKELRVNHFVGLYQSEGFGHVLVHPPFLESTAENSPLAKFKLQKNAVKPGVSASDQSARSELKLLPTKDIKGIVLNLTFKANDESCKQYIYTRVTDFVSLHKDKFSKDGKRFASQWGNIRAIASQSKGYAELYGRLFEKETGYLTHGVASEKWKEGNRLALLQTFMKDRKADIENAGLGPEEATKYVDRYLPVAVVNLSSEMAK